MVKYTGPRVRIVRRLGILPGLTKKVSKMRRKSPGEHGKLRFSRAQRPSLAGDYKERLIEKQKLRYNYGITESQLISYYKKAKKEKESTGGLLLKFLESRLDCIVYRLGFAPTIPSARQLINHRHILVNNKIVNIPSFLCEKGDTISVKDKEKSKNLVSVYLETLERKRRLVEGRMKSIQFSKKHNIRTLLPGHLEINADLLVGKLVKSIKRSNHIMKIKELKVVEYYSR
jgi:small subunit ribosomal protein S4